MSSTSAIALRLGVDRSTVKRWIDSGKLRALVLHTGERSLIRVRESDLEAFLDRYRDDSFDGGDEGR